MGGGDSGDALAVTHRSAASTEVTPGATFARFMMRGVLGRGGMGVVIEAYDPDLDRKVAVKLIRPDAVTGDDGQQRLQREAQAMARLAHPNVLTVYEVGRAEDQLFIAMELVDGTTLKSWLETPRRWREIVATFIAAGRGLEAAHRAGLIHRDFKPENVLIGRDGRPRVADFGLAVLGGHAIATTGGTPAYMSPEQWLGAELDARSDQFSFCATMWRAVHGQTPFPGSSIETMRAAVLAGERRAAPPGTRAPKWLSRALARGLARDPADRWPDLGALLDVLATRLATRRLATWIAATASVIAVLAVTVAAVATASEPAACTAPSDRIAPVWGPERRRAIEHHLVASDPTLGARRFAAIAAVLDGETRSWAEGHVAACRATRDGRQSETLLDLRIRCLDDWLGRVTGFTTEISHVTGPAQLDGAIEGLAGIGAVERCADTRLLQALAPPPINPRVAVEVRAIGDELTAIQAQQRTGTVAGLVGRADAALVRARTAGYPPVLADALAARAQLAAALDDTPTALAHLREIPEVAARGHDAERAARSWSAMIRLVGKQLARPDEARAMMPAARAASAQLGDPPLLLAQVLDDEGFTLAISGDPKTALLELERARTLAEAAGAGQPGSPAGPLLVGILKSLGLAYKYATDLEPAAAILRQAIAQANAVYGLDSLESAAGYLALGELARDRNQLDEADRALREAIRIREARTGESPALAIALSALGDVTTRRGRTTDAVAVGERAVAVARATMSSNPAVLASIIAPLADSYDEAGRVDDALALYDEVMAIGERARLDSINVAAWAINRGDTLRKRGRCAEALADFQRAAAIGERFQGRTSPTAGSANHAAGECLHALHRDADAIAALERSLEYKVLGYQEAYANQGRGLLGQLLIATGRDPARGAALIREARTRLRALGSSLAGDLGGRAP